MATLPTKIQTAIASRSPNPLSPNPNLSPKPQTSNPKTLNPKPLNPLNPKPLTYMDPFREPLSENLNPSHEPKAGGSCTHGCADEAQWCGPGKPREESSFKGSFRAPVRVPLRVEGSGFLSSSFQDLPLLSGVPLRFLSFKGSRKVPLFLYARWRMPAYEV